MRSNGPMATDMTLYARLGGREAIEQVTARFYASALEDPLLAPHFKGVDMVRLTGMQAAFLATAFDGPDSYRGRDLAQAHAGMGLRDEHVDAVIAHLAAALTEAGAGDEIIAEVAAVAEMVRPDVLGR